VDANRNVTLMTKVEFCQARKTCRSMGSDIASFEQVDFQTFQRFMNANYGG